MNEEFLKQIKKLANAATTGPWEIDGHGKVVSKSHKSVSGEDALVALVYSHDADHHRFYYQCEQDTAKFVAASREIVPALLEEIETLKLKLAVYETASKTDFSSFEDDYIKKHIGAKI